jgi:hypothetical protein
MRQFGQPFWRWDYDDVVERHWITGMGNRFAGNSGSGLGHNRWRAIDDRVRQRIQQSDPDSSGFDSLLFDTLRFDSSGFKQPHGPAGPGNYAGRE